MNNNLLTVKVTKKTIEAERIVSFELVSPNGDDLPPFTAGSHIDVHIAGDYIRQYSLCNAPHERHRYLLGVLKETNGSGGSAAMHDQVKEGDLLQISVPRNSFHLDDNSEFSLLLAGGIGVTPIMSMARHLAKLGKPFKMHYCARSFESCAFYTELNTPGYKDQVTFHFDDRSEDQKLDLVNLLATRPEGANLYVCGPKGFMEAVIGNAERAWPADTIHREYFSADPQAGHDDDESFQVKIQSTGEIYDIPEDKSLVDALFEYGIKIPVSCEQGICGTCITGVLEGIPDHRDAILSDEEHTANDQMTACCSRSKSKLLVLDL